MAVLYRDTGFQHHETGRHPENSARLQAIDARLDASSVLQLYEQEKPEPASDGVLTLIHTDNWLGRVKQLDAAGGGRVDADTIMSPESLAVARLAAGSAVAAVDRVLSGQHSTAVCLVRPPGHHATPTRGMGFCLFNNVAIAAAHAVRNCGLQRVLIVDWDVHHGNGTQDAFYEDPSVFFASAHRHPFYPGTGAADETGRGPGLGTVFNLPCRYGTPRRDLLSIMRGHFEAAAEACRPELVLISAGFDAHHADPIGSLGLESEDFGLLTDVVSELAAAHASGRIVSVLEGGYAPTALAESVEIHMQHMAVAERNAGPA